MEELENTSVGGALAELRGTMAAGGVEDPAVDAELIVGHVLGVSRGRVQALALLGSALGAEELATARRLAEDRASRIPLQHLTGRAPFREIELSVGPGVFVPRPETEGVAQFAIDALRAADAPEPVAVDLCTGSGAIALSLAHEVRAARVWALEKSPEAHAWASRNVERWGDGRVRLLLGDVSDPHAELEALAGRVDVLVSNPPYVPIDCVPRDPEVRDYDPELALYGGADGLDVVRIISRLGLGLVRPDGAIVLEHAETQGEAIRRLLESDGWRDAATHVDLTGRDRTTTAVR